MEFLIEARPIPINQKSLDEALLNVTDGYDPDTRTYTTWYGLRMGVELCGPSDFKRSGEMGDFSLFKRRIRISRELSLPELIKEFDFHTQRLKYFPANALACTVFGMLTGTLVAHLYAHLHNFEASLTAKILSGIFLSYLVFQPIPVADTIIEYFVSRGYGEKTTQWPQFFHRFLTGRFINFSKSRNRYYDKNPGFKQ